MVNKQKSMALWLTLLFLYSNVTQMSAYGFTSGQSTSLQDYLQKVLETNSQLKALVKSRESQELSLNAGMDVYAPQLLASALWTRDKRPTNAASFQGTQTNTAHYSLGVGERTPWGQALKLSYNIYHFDQIGSSSLFVPRPQYYDIYPQLEITQSLWQNSFGAATRAEANLAEAMANANKYADSYKIRMELLNSELAYWKLAYLKRIILVRQNTLARSKKLKEWAQRRVNYNLSDRTDLYQAEAAEKIRELELSATTSELRSAIRDFNSYLAIESDETNLEIDDLNTDRILSIKAPERGEKTDELLALEYQSKVAQEQATLESHRLNPKVDVTGQYALYGRDVAMSQANNNAFKNNNYIWSIGVQVQAPLDFGLRSDLKHAKQAQAIAAESMVDRKLLVEKTQWTDLTKKLEEVRNNVALASQLTNAQQIKLKNEESRLQKGRTTTYQVLLFEQDYAQSQLLLLENKLSLLQTLARMKLFGRN